MWSLQTGCVPVLLYIEDISDDGSKLLSAFSCLQLRELDSCSLQPWLRFNYILENVKTEAGYVMAYWLALFTKWSISCLNRVQAKLQFYDLLDRFVVYEHCSVHNKCLYERSRARLNHFSSFPLLQSIVIVMCSFSAVVRQSPILLFDY